MAVNGAGAASWTFQFSNEPVSRGDVIRLINLYLFP